MADDTLTCNKCRYAVIKGDKRHLHRAMTYCVFHEKKIDWSMAKAMTCQIPPFDTEEYEKLTKKIEKSRTDYSAILDMRRKNAIESMKSQAKEARARELF